MTLGADVWGYITGVLSLLAVIFQLTRMNLPSTKLKEFDDLFKETEDLLHEADEEGLLSGARYVRFVHQTNETLVSLRKAAQPLRSRVHMAKTLSQQCLGIFTGLSPRISVLCSEVKEVKAEIASTSDKARETLRQLSLIQNQQAAQRVALEMLSDGQLSDASNSADVSLSEDQGSSHSFGESRSHGDDAENKTFNEAENLVTSSTEDKTLPSGRDTIHETVEIVKETRNTAVACGTA